MLKPKSPNAFQRFSRKVREALGISLPAHFTLSNVYTGGNVNFERAFTIEGVDYYWVPDQTEVPAARGLAALAIYQEMSMGVTREYIQAHCEETKKILTPGRTLDLTRLVKLNENLNDRSKLMVLPEYVYKLASVVFIAQNESPYTYDWKLNRKKIELFKKHGDVDFFLTTPLGKLIPLSQQPNNDMQNYFEVAETVDKMHWDFLLGK